MGNIATGDFTSKSPLVIFLEFLFKMVAGVLLLAGYVIYMIIILIAFVLYIIKWCGSKLFVKFPLLIRGLSSNYNQRNILYNFFTTFLKLIPFLVIFNMVGIWFAPLYGLAACIAYAVFAQIQFISFTLFGTKNSKFIKEHIKTNRFGLTLLASIMITFSSAKNLRRETAFGVSIASIISMLILACAV